MRFPIFRPRRNALAARLVFAALAAMLVPSAVAEAATTASRANTRVMVSAAPGMANDIRISRSGGVYTIADLTDTVTTGSGCSPSADPHAVTCSGTLKSIEVLAADRDDRVVKTAPIQGVIDGGDGNDTLEPGPSGYPNQVSGGAGTDVLTGGQGTDYLDGGPGPDVISGGGGAYDRARYPGTADVTVSIDGVADDGAVGEGDNVRTDVEGIESGSGDDTLTGSSAANYLSAGAGDDVLVGLGDNDILTGGADADDLDGGGGNDTFYSCCSPDGGDVMSGGTGVDLAKYWRSDPITVSLNGVADDGTAGEGDNVRLDVENVQGGHGPDTLTGNSAANHLLGGDGDDVLDGAGGDDTLTGQNGVDSLGGAGGDDVLDGGAGADRLSGGTERDRADYTSRTAPVNVTIGALADDGESGEGDDVLADVEDVSGGGGGDSLRGSPSRNQLVGGDGQDNLAGLGGPDTLAGGPGSDTLRGGAGSDILDTVDGIGANDDLDGEADSDTCSFDRFDVWANCEAIWIP
jgi:Ca2+-binding RTX toxin-like protein